MRSKSIKNTTIVFDGIKAKGLVIMIMVIRRMQKIKFDRKVFFGDKLNITFFNMDESKNC